MLEKDRSGICTRALGLLGTQPTDQKIYPLLQRLKPGRQAQIADLMHKMCDYSLSFMQLLIATSNHSDFAEKKFRTLGITNSEQKAIERAFRPLERSFLVSAASYSDDAYALLVTTAYFRRVMKSPRILSYLVAVHPKIVAELASEGIVERPRSNRRRAIGVVLPRPDRTKIK